MGFIFNFESPTTFQTFNQSQHCALNIFSDNFISPLTDSSSDQFKSEIKAKMVLCRQENSFDRCEDNIDDGASDDSECISRLEKSCDCVKIVGHDHLKSKRARKFRCKSARIRQLAEPKNLTKKYCEEVQVVGKVDVEIVRPDEEQTPVRIKLLAYPKVRKLVSSRNTYKSIVDKEWYGRFENLINQSMLTMYSRLANVHLPNKQQRKKWTKADWERHCQWLKKRALPKMPKLPPPAKKKVKKVPIEQLKASMLALSRPRHQTQKYRPRCGYVSTVKDSARVYAPTQRVLALAQPKEKPEGEEEVDVDPFKVKPSALKSHPCK